MEKDKRHLYEKKRVIRPAITAVVILILGIIVNAICSKKSKNKEVNQ